MADTIQARPTLYRGTRMRSRLEAGFAAWLDDFGIIWEYEPCALAAPGLGQWLPDFFFILPHWRNAGEYQRFYVDVKPAPFLEDRARAAAEVHRWNNIVIECGLGGRAVAAVNDNVDPQGVWAADWLHNDEGASLTISKLVWVYSRIDVEGDPIYCLAPTVHAEFLPWYGEWWKNV